MDNLVHQLPLWFGFTYTDVRKQIVAKYSRTLPQGSITDEIYFCSRRANHDVTARYCSGFRQDFEQISWSASTPTTVAANP